MVDVVEVGADAICKKMEVALDQRFLLDKPAVDAAQASDQICALGSAIQILGFRATCHGRCVR
ncbi:MAG: hypothetical protein DI537_51145 [Stutzerimonas stutzeri]|nr:MAG: hypothetical protein DI537_51145 [Stutzerimonas stutzeri]